VKRFVAADASAVENALAKFSYLFVLDCVN
jgi:hypothetical protein